MRTVNNYHADNNAQSEITILNFQQVNKILFLTRNAHVQYKKKE